ncbi:hypothetical protein Rt10032_c12g4780 [Rhodotorula toruloides]|uniref:Proteophosphoglycan ppg4 n=1 Tax=Rhodotorula toruloides TaxID=5286 RepID=A0A511KK73_RHOTO|nr:hypothetical protein Rt10032_c12g4780 [Rhodotorula toruloides]
MIFSRLSLVTFLGLAAASLAFNVEPALESRTLHLGLGGGLDIGAGAATPRMDMARRRDRAARRTADATPKSDSKKAKVHKSTSTKKKTHRSSTPAKTGHSSGHSLGHSSTPAKKDHSSHKSSSWRKGHSAACAKAQSHLVTALKTCHKDIVRLGGELKACLEGVHHEQAHLVVKAVAGVIGEMHASLKVAASTCVKVAAGAKVDFEVKIVAHAVADLLNALYVALSPLEVIVKVSPGLVLLLSIHLIPLCLTVVGMLHALFAISGGLVAAVAGLLHAHLGAFFRLLGCGSLVVALDLWTSTPSKQTRSPTSQSLSRDS